jgi:glycerophosphoryl diester phosphodiesterase
LESRLRIPFAGMEIIGHRGASFDAPENTLAAVNLAWEQGADAVEVDVHLSRDGRISVIHDDNTRKTAGVKKKISKQSWAELQRLDVGRWKGPQWAGEQIPELKRIIGAVPKGKRLFVEVKCGDEFVEAASPFLRSLNTPRLVVIGFSLQTMQRVKKTFPQLEVCWIVEFKRNLATRRWSPSPEQAIAKAAEAGLDGLDVGASGPISKQFVEKAKAAGLQVYVWTVDSVSKAKALRVAGVDGIATNRPGWIRQKLEQAGD